MREAVAFPAQRFDECAVGEKLSNFIKADDEYEWREACDARYRFSAFMHYQNSGFNLATTSIGFKPFNDLLDFLLANVASLDFDDDRALKHL